jgi:hypothetical protein
MVIVTPCFHRLHYDCLFEWFSENNDKIIDEKLKTPIHDAIMTYNIQASLYNEQFRPVHVFIPSFNGDGGSFQLRGPTIGEMQSFSPPPITPVLTYTPSVLCKLACPMCWCDWKLMLLSGDEHIDFEKFS